MDVFYWYIFKCYIRDMIWYCGQICSTGKRVVGILSTAAIVTMPNVTRWTFTTIWSFHVNACCGSRAVVWTNFTFIDIRAICSNHWIAASASAFIWANSVHAIASRTRVTGPRFPAFIDVFASQTVFKSYKKALKLDISHFCIAFTNNVWKSGIHSSLSRVSNIFTWTTIFHGTT